MISLTVRDHGKHVVVSRGAEEQQNNGGDNGSGQGGAARMHG